MNSLECKQVCKKAIDKFGYSAQLGMLMEECAELIVATNKLTRAGGLKISSNSKEFENFIEECADVEIMLFQVRLMFDWHLLSDRVEITKHNKLNKLKKLIENNK